MRAELVFPTIRQGCCVSTSRLKECIRHTFLFILNPLAQEYLMDTTVLLTCLGFLVFSVAVGFIGAKLNH